MQMNVSYLVIVCDTILSSTIVYYSTLQYPTVSYNNKYSTIISILQYHYLQAL